MGISNRITTKKWLLYIPVVIVALTGFFFFDQAFDMKISMTHADELITSVLNGEWFYERTYQHAITEGYLWRSAELSGAIYNIIIYITMAIWALPLYVISHVFQFPPHRYTELLNLWGRVMVILASLISAWQINKLHKELNPNRQQAKSDLDIRYLFLSSPIVLFSVIVFNQYDILSVLITIIALRLYYKDRMIAFSLVMSLAICFKLFAILIFVPLLLLREKRFLHLLGYFLIGISLYALTTAFSTIFDPGYSLTQKMMSKVYNYGDWVYATAFPGGLSNASIFIVTYFLLCLAAYLQHGKQCDQEKTDYVPLLFGCAAYMLFFAFVNWHPQWVIILVPFICLLMTEVNSSEMILILETVLNISFLLLFMNNWCGKSLVVETLFVRFFHPKTVENYNILRVFLNQNGIGNVAFMSLLIVAMIGFLVLMRRFIQGKSLNLAKKESPVLRTVLISCRSCLLFIYALSPIVHMLTA